MYGIAATGQGQVLEVRTLTVTISKDSTEQGRPHYSSHIWPCNMLTPSSASSDLTNAAVTFGFIFQALYSQSSPFFFSGISSLAPAVWPRLILAVHLRETRGPDIVAKYDASVKNPLTTSAQSVTALFHRNRIFSIHYYIKTALHYVILIDRSGVKRMRKIWLVLADRNKLTILME